MIEENNLREKVQIDVLGCCVTRDIVSRLVQKHNRIEVKENHQCQTESVAKMVEVDDSYKINNDDLKGRKRGFYRIKQELNETIKNKLINSGSEWLLLDFYHVGMMSLEVKSGSETHYYQIDWGKMSEHDIKIAYDKRGKTIESITKVRYCEIPELGNLIDKFVQFVLSRYGDNIIVIDLFYTHWFLNKNGEVSNWRDPEVEEVLGYGRLFMQRFIERTNAYYVMCPTNVITDEYNRKINHLHYVSEYYDYASDCVYNIVSKDPLYLKNNNMLFMQITEKMDQIRIGDAVSKNNTLKHIDLMWKKSNKIENVDDVILFAKEIAEKSIDKDFLANIYLRIGKYYFQRKDGGKDLNQSAEWFKKAVDLGQPAAKIEYFDILWKINTPNSLLKMICFGYEQSIKGNPEIMGRLGRAYRKGRGVKKNLIESSKWLKQSADLGTDWAKCEYYDVLWDINTEESLKIMVDYGYRESNNGNYELMARLARAYRDGRGVKIDIKKALSLMSTAANNGVDWAKIEFFDMIWPLNNSDLDKIGFEMMLELADNGDGIVMRDLSRCYRDGRGVSVDYSKAEEWMRKAVLKETPGTKTELDEIIDLKKTNLSLIQHKDRIRLKRIF